VADEVAAAYGQRLPMYITEIGWSSSNFGGGVSEEVQAVNLVELYVRVRATGDVAGIWWYDLVEDIDEDHGEEGFGLIRRDPVSSRNAGETKPAGHAFAALAHFWAGCTTIDGEYRHNRVFALSCPDGDLQVVLDARRAELEPVLAEGGTLVDLLGELPDLTSGDVGPYVGRPVGVTGPVAQVVAVEDDGPPLPAMAALVIVVSVCVGGVVVWRRARARRPGRD
ncbi:MAG: hypothetical protein FWE61_11900, partial [Micrococcales bacterium]|nr:hypothetical protein [Micrococcales bacterium]